MATQCQQFISPVKATMQNLCDTKGQFKSTNLSIFVKITYGKNNPVSINTSAISLHCGVIPKDWKRFKEDEGEDIKTVWLGLHNLKSLCKLCDIHVSVQQIVSIQAPPTKDFYWEGVYQNEESVNKFVECM